MKEKRSSLQKALDFFFASALLSLGHKYSMNILNEQTHWFVQVVE